MQRRFGLLMLLTVFVVLACAYSNFMLFHLSGLPFSIHIVDARTAVIEPIPGASLPSTLKAGDQIDLATQPRSTRIAISKVQFASILPQHTYKFLIRRGGTVITVPVTSVNLSTVTGVRWFQWAFLCYYVLLSGIALLALWRGRDRASSGLALWAIAFLAGITGSVTPVDGMPWLSVLLGTVVFYLLARIGFYVLVESMVGTALTTRTRALWRGGFLLLLGVGAIQALGGPLVFVATGWAELLRSQYGFAFTASYLVPVALLVASYRRAERVRHLRLRWMLWGSAAFVTAIFLTNSPILGFPASLIAYSFMFVIAMAGFLYAVLRHRVVDVSVFIDRTLVYGGMTALVVGILAAVNSLVEHAALGTNASLLVQVIVPLALGIVLSRVRLYLDRIVEQVFFRRKYLAEKALRRFARHCAGYENTQDLLAAAAQIIYEKLGTPGVALYLRKGGQYAAAGQQGDISYPKSVKTDDAAFAAARSGVKDIDLSELHSALGSDGYVFPMGAQAMLVCANRPEEHYAAEEHKLLTQVARQVGAALLAINAREDRDFVRSLARGTLDPATVRDQALRLETTWLEM